MLFRHRLQPVWASWSGVSPLSEAWVATGWKMGRETGPCGKVKIEARALVVYVEEKKERSASWMPDSKCSVYFFVFSFKGTIGVRTGPDMWTRLTEHLATISKVRAGDSNRVDIARSIRLFYCCTTQRWAINEGKCHGI